MIFEHFWNLFDLKNLANNLFELFLMCDRMYS
jgi:hypothetical protein